MVRAGSWTTSRVSVSHRPRGDVEMAPSAPSASGARERGSGTLGHTTRRERENGVEVNVSVRHMYLYSREQLESTAMSLAACSEAWGVCENAGNSRSKTRGRAMLPTSREVEVNVSVRHMYLYSREVRGVVARLRAECGSLSVHAVALAHTQVKEKKQKEKCCELRS
ncbi:unnamed protein product [Lampetra planeri]